MTSQETAATSENANNRVAFLGPHGTFCEEAALSQEDLARSELIPMRSIAEVFEAVDSGDCTLGVVPLENTIEGSVALTLDMLVFDSEAMIQREIDHNISLCLAGKPGSDLESARTILSHPHALAQCRSYIDENLPLATTKASDSTASAAHMISEMKELTAVAICPTEAAKKYGLDILDSHIQDRDINQTRFVVIGKGIPAPTGNDKTSIVAFQRANRPGSLVAMLTEFAARGIDLTKLESRPTKEGLGQYCFLMDFVGHIAQKEIADCLSHVRTEQADIKFLGSFQVAGDTDVKTQTINSKVWKETDQWLADLLGKVKPSTHP